MDQWLEVGKPAPVRKIMTNVKMATKKLEPGWLHALLMVLRFSSIVCLPAALPALSAQSKLPPDATRTFSSPSTYAPDLAERVMSSELRDVVPRYTAGSAVAAALPHGARYRARG